MANAMSAPPSRNAPVIARLPPRLGFATWRRPSVLTALSAPRSLGIREAGASSSAKGFLSSRAPAEPSATMTTSVFVVLLALR